MVFRQRTGEHCLETFPVNRLSGVQSYVGMESMSFSTQPSTYHPLPNVKELLCEVVSHSYKWTNDLWGGSQDESWQRLDCGVRRLKANCSVWAHPAGHGQTSHGYSAAGGLISHPSFSQEATAQYLLAALCIFFWKYKQKGLCCLLFGLTVAMKGLQHMVYVLKRFCLVGLVSVLVWVFVLVWYGLFGFGSEKAEKNKAILFNSHRSPASHPQFSVPVFVFVPWALSHEPASDCFHHCHKPPTKSQMPSRRMLKMKNLEALATRVDPDFLLHVNTCENICAYILSSTFVITKHCVPFGLGLFCFGRLFAVLRGSGICMIKFPIGNWPPPTPVLIIYPCIFFV